MAATDETLAKGTLDGDREAFGELYDRRATLIRAICLDATGNIDAARDLTQEVFLRAYRNLAKLRNQKLFTAWLTGIARQVCREWRQGRLHNHRRHIPLEEDLPSPHSPPTDERLAFLTDALQQLPERERLSLHAYYLQEMNIEEARAALGLSKSGLFRLLASARRRLRGILVSKEVRS